MREYFMAVLHKVDWHRIALEVRLSPIDGWMKKGPCKGGHRGEL